MNIKEIGEFGLIDLIKRDAIVDAESVVVGIGDDAAVFRPTKGMLQLIATDMLAEGIHFDLRFIEPFELGYKALAVNLSDIAAMGGIPKQAVISIALPERLDVAFVVELYRGLKAVARAFQVNIVGGDTIGSLHDLTINVAVTGEIAPEFLQRRSSAKAGELVVVTGRLGASAAGLLCLQNGLREASFAPPLISAHLTPVPQVELAQVIARYASSMNDISDGLASESKEIATASGVGMLLKEHCLPCDAAVAEVSHRLEKKALDLILYGGEDYQLIFTIAPEKYDALLTMIPPRAVTVIGEVTSEKDSVSLLRLDGAIVKLEPKGYNHFT